MTFGRGDRVLVVGGGRAASAAVGELRGRGFAGNITVLSGESTPAYDRTACSKGILTGGRRPNEIRLPQRADDARWLLGRRAVGIDPKRQLVATDAGEWFPYEGLVIATGCDPVLPEGFPPGVHELHTVTDAWKLHHDLRQARSVAVIGAGLTGCETASAVRQLARECVLIDSHPQVLTRAIGTAAGRLVTATLRRAGVHMRLGRRVIAVEGGRRGWRLSLDDGSAVHAELVVATLGERPASGWLADAGVPVAEGIVCDESLRVIGIPNAVAAGGAVRWPNPGAGGALMRCDHWATAHEQGLAAAANLVSSATPVAVVPRFSSSFFGLRVQVGGRLDPHAQVTVNLLSTRRDAARGGVTVSYHQAGVLVGVVAINAPSRFTTLVSSIHNRQGPCQ